MAYHKQLDEETKEIKFEPRTWSQLTESYTKLKERYKKVEIHKTLQGCLYVGYFLVSN